MKLKYSIKLVLDYLTLKVKTVSKGLFISNSVSIKHNTRIKKMSQVGEIWVGSGVSMGYNTEIFVWNGKLSIGDGTSLNDNCKIYENVRIGKLCLFASNIFISSGTHTFVHKPTYPIKLQDREKVTDKPVVIEDDCWIGFGVVVLPGVYVGKGAVLGANSVVTSNVFPYTVVGGVPAKRISDRFDFANNAPKILSCVNSDHWPYFYRGIDYTCLTDPTELLSGIRINSELTILFLSKGSTENIQIVGKSFLSADFHIYLNEDLIDVIKIEKGDFKTSILIPKESNHKGSHLLAQIPAFIKDQFTICAIEFKSHQNVTQAIKWKVKEVAIL